MSGLDGWTPDAVFLDRALALAETADLVTIDVFDTALTRLLDSPADLFCEVERRLGGEIGPDAEGFALARETAEREARLSARAQHGAEEIGYEAILDHLPRAFSRWRDQIRRIEFAAEADVLVGVPDILALTQRLAERGTPFAFVSDMYLPAAVIADRLTACGFTGWADLLVSAETGATKATGRQWSVLERRFPGTRLLHIGDDQHADIDLPQTFGIATLPYLRARSARRSSLPFTPALLPFSRAQRAQVLQSRADPAAEPADAAFWSDFGHVWGGIVLAGFIRWLEAQVIRHGLDQLYFCARDGWLVHRAWRASGAAARTGLPGVYLEVSRRPLNLARGWRFSSPSRLDRDLLSFLASSDGSVTVGNALRRAGLTGIPALEADARQTFGSLETRLVWPDSTGQFEHLMQRHAASVHAALANDHDALLGYLRQSGLAGGGRAGLVDLGWHATMQRSLRSILEAEGIETAIHGFYYGLWPAASNNRHAAGPADSAFASDFEPPEERPELTDAVEILEELYTAPHGTVLGYREDDSGRFQAVVAGDAMEAAQFERANKPFQDACLETVAALFDSGRSGTLLLEEMTPAVVRATLGAVTLSPDVRELRLLGGLEHHATFDHVTYRTLVPDGLPFGAEVRTQALRACGWRTGTVLSWARRASPDDVGGVRDWVRHMMRHYGERVLRQLG